MAWSSVRARFIRLGSLLRRAQLLRRTDAPEQDPGSSVVCGNRVPPATSDRLDAKSLLLALDEQSILLQAALESMDQGLMVIDCEERVLLCNRRVAELLDLPHDIMVQRPFLKDLTQYQLSSDEFAVAWEEVPRAALELGFRASPQVYEQQRLNGTVLEIRAVPLMAGGIVLTYTDITARRKAEADLREREAHHRLLAENATDIITRKDLNGHRTYISPACRDVLGYEPEELIGTTPIENAHPDDRSAVAEGLNALISGSIEVETITYRAPHKDGHWVWLEARRRLVRDKADMPCEVVSVSRDVTERRELEDHLRQSQKMEAVGQLTEGIAHDFKNLLTLIIGNAELIMEDSPDPGVKSLARMSLEAAEQGAELTQQLLTFGRRQSLTPEPLMLGEVIEGMMSLLGRTLGEHIQIEAEIGQPQSAALADRTFLETAILNLVVNARDAMPQGGKLTISTGERLAGLGDGNLPLGQPVVFIRISDTGTGMPPEVLSRVFEPFFTTKGVGKGTGLGLSMVYGFAEQSGGYVNIKSKEGEGTCVTLLFRATESKSVPPPAIDSAPSAPARGCERVLVVEDERQVLTYVSSQLQSLGYDVIGVASGSEALKVLEKNRNFDLLFTDVVLPHGMSGIQLARRMKEMGLATKVLLTSGYSEEVFEQHGRPDENMLLLRKPYRRKELAEVLRQALGQAA